jgi:hypothetical protein
MKILSIVIPIIFVVSSSCVRGQQSSDCVFDPESINDEFIRNNPDVASYRWFDDSKEATILMKSGEYVYLKKWACTSYGMEAKKIVVTPLIANEESSFWVGALLEFGKEFLSKGDFSVYQSAIKAGDWLRGDKITVNSKHEIDIPHDNYPEFFARIERQEDMIVMSFYFYMN